MPKLFSLFRSLFGKRNIFTQIEEAVETLTEVLDAVDNVVSAGNALANEQGIDRALVSDWNRAMIRYQQARQAIPEIDLSL